MATTSDTDCARILVAPENPIYGRGGAGMTDTSAGEAAVVDKWCRLENSPPG